MARPALLIGLGGTGQWVLTYVKKELLDYTRGQGIPDEVKLVAFDTTSSIEGGSRKSGDEEPIAVDDVKLDPGEFVHLGGNIEPTVRGIVERQEHPHIASWLQARTYLNRLSSGQYLLEDGAGQKRPFGRMAVFKDLEANPEASKIFGTLRDAIAGIREKVREDRMLEISIVASLAGGTGAGMAIDIAHLARTIAAEVIQDKFVLRGFFVLPRAFQRIPGGDSTDMRARAFAAIRELGRFLNVFGDRKYPMVYNPDPTHREQLAKKVEKRLFDLCYLIDAQRERNSLDGVEARHGVFPSIADALLAFIDDNSGQVYTEHVKNVAGGLVDPSGEVAYFSTLGTYALELPIRDIAEESAGRLALEFLNKLVRPELNDEGRPIRLSATENTEKPGKRGAELAGQFLASPGAVEGIRGTLFLQEVARTVDGGHARNDQLVDAATGRDNRDWLNVIEPDDVTEEVRELRAEVGKILDHRLRQDVQSSRESKKRPAHDHERVEREVADVQIEYLGRPQADGSTVGGKFREALAKYELLQTEQFRQGLARYAVAQLNGASRTDPLEAKAGKLGFVTELLETVAERLDLYVRFLGRVRERRAQQGRLERQREQVQAARGRMLEDRGKSGLLNRGAAYRSQEEFLDYSQDLLELEKDDLVFAAVNRIATHLRDSAIGLRDDLRSWAEALALGTADQPSLLRALGDALEGVRERRAKTSNFHRVRRQETDDDYEQGLYARFAEQQLEKMLESVSWQLDNDGEGIELEILGQPLARKKIRQRDRPTRANAQLVLDEAQNAFHRLVDSETIAARLIDLHDSRALSDELYRNGSPLCSTHRTPPKARPANFLSVSHDGAASQNYFDQVVNQLKARTNARSEDAQVVESAGAHKCTLISTLDIVDADSLTAYEDLYRAYRNFTDDRRLLHNFPAEVNAVEFEERLQKELQLPYRLFSPRIVFLLEHRDWVRQFVRCLVLGLVRLERDEEENPFYLLDLPDCELRGRGFTAQRIELTEHSTEGAPELLAAMDTFVFRQNDFRERPEIPIVPAHLSAALVQAERTLGSGGSVIEAIQNFKNDGLVSHLKKSDKSYEKDLGNLFHLMLNDETDRLAAV